METLKFAQFTSSADPSFWHALAKQKLDHFKLSDAAVQISGFYPMGSRADVPARGSVGADSFSKMCAPVNTMLMRGTLYNMNTMEAFKEYDVPAAVTREAQECWEAIASGAALEDMSQICRFTVLTFSDLKKHRFYYWFGSEQVADLFSKYIAYRKDTPNCHAFLVQRNDDATVDIKDVKDWATVHEDRLVVGFSDACGLPSNPGWPLRNILLTLAYYFGTPGQPLKVKVVALRATPESSITFDVEIPPLDAAQRSSPTPPGVIKGLEKDKKQRLRPRLCDLSESCSQTPSMDPARLAATAVGLNLSLMRWRLMPEIDLPKVANCKCLLLGAGTLGCNVARLLLGWGVETITLVDNGTVSYSNPVRQTLFTFEDSAAAKPKAEAAAFRLKEIFPGVNATGVSMSIPMPGHPVSGKSLEEAVANASKIEKLITEHDAVFLLMDTRESRWLPTVICAAQNKMCFTAAVGFDSFVAMRHGVEGDGYAAGLRNVGCYFCNDVVAPTNSTKDRTLDQQCTVSRPGVSMMVSAAVVELMVAMLHHPLGALAPVEGGTPAEDSPEPGSSCLGSVPHQVRGFVADFRQMCIGGMSFDKCTGCSAKVVDMYKKSLKDIVTNVCNTPSYLEDLTGLSAMHQAVEDMGDLDWDDSDASDSDLQ